MKVKVHIPSNKKIKKIDDITFDLVQKNINIKDGLSVLN